MLRHLLIQFPTIGESILYRPINAKCEESGAHCVCYKTTGESSIELAVFRAASPSHLSALRARIMKASCF